MEDEVLAAGPWSEEEEVFITIPETGNNHKIGGSSKNLQSMGVTRKTFFDIA